MRVRETIGVRNAGSRLHLRRPRAITAVMAAAPRLLMVAAATWVSSGHVFGQELKIPTDPDNDPCLSYNVSFTATSKNLILGQSTTLQWDVQVPANCLAPLLMLRNTTTPENMSVGSEGAAVVAPFVDTTYVLRTLQHELGRIDVKVAFPTDSTGAPVVTITANNQRALLVQALSIPRAKVFVQNHVEMDLSDYYIHIEEGVQLRSGRNSRQPGARLYVRPDAVRADGGALFRAIGDNVRISGLRIDGGRPNVAEIFCLFSDDPDCDNLRAGIFAQSRVNLEIDNNELFGWSREAIRIVDDEGRIGRTVNPLTVRIHDNYIHHNQGSGMGYGVNVAYGAYALIEKNVFDYNRHAIAADGRPGTGYFAYRNLVLQHGGVQGSVDPFTFYTHQFDMHGRDHCGVFSNGDEYNCGPAGEYVDVRYNTFYNAHGPAFKLRGTPSIGVDLVSNVYGGPLGDPYEQNETGLNEQGNVVFDGGAGRLNARNTSILSQSAEAAGVTVWSMNGPAIQHEQVYGVGDPGWQLKGTGDFNADGQADIVWHHANGQVAIWHMSAGVKIGEAYPGGNVPAPWKIQAAGDFDGDGHADLLWRYLSDAAEPENGRLTIWFKGEYPTDTVDVYPPASPPVYIDVPDTSWTVKGAGDFDGDGRADILWRHANGQVAIWHMAGGIRLADVYPGGQDPESIWKIERVGDFNHDGRSDILWRASNGQLALWFSGLMEGAVYPSYQNASGPVGLSWQVQGVSDFNADGRDDILWRSSGGQVGIWLMDGGRFVGEAYPRVIEGSRQIKGLLPNQ